MKWYLHAFRNYANFDGRSSRTEYWMFGLFNIMFAVFFYSIDLIFDIGHKQFGFGILYWVYAVIALIPGLSLAVRRLHDTGKSGYYLFLSLLPVIGSIWLLVLFITKSDDEENDYGEKPVNSDIANFINDDKTCSNIVIIILIWMFINTIVWKIVARYYSSYAVSEYLTMYSGIINLIWMYVPIFLSLAIKNHKWKTIMLIFSTIYLMFNFYELVKQQIFSH